MSEPQSASDHLPVSFSRYRCLRVRHYLAPCRACADVCPRGAVSVDREPAFDAARCNGCGVCTAACPTEALALKGTSVTALREELAAGKVIVACRHARPAADVQVPCLGLLDSGLLLAAVAAGAEPQLDLGPCAGCPERAGSAGVQAAVAGANAVLAAQAAPRRVGVRHERRYSAEPVVSRRQLFGLVRRRIDEQRQEEPPEPSTPVEKGAAIRAVLAPERRALLVQAVAKAVAARPGRLRTGPGLPFFDLTLAGSCDNCGMCLTFCPTAALSICKEGETTSFTFSAARCLGCGLCILVCPRQALALASPLAVPALDQPRVLRRQTARRCACCGAEYLPTANEPHCPSCARRLRLQSTIRQKLFGS